MQLGCATADHLVGVSCHYESDHLDSSAYTPIIEIGRVCPFTFLHFQRSVYLNLNSIYRSDQTEDVAGDYIGRTYLPSISAIMTTSHPRVLLLSASRILFVPLFLGCRLSTSSTGAIFNSDIIYFALLILFGLTNG